MRKYLSIIIIFILLLGVTFIIKNSFNNTIFFLDNVVLQNSSSNSNMFAIMVENDDGEYVEYTDSDSWPIGMTFNDELSGCTDGNGNTVDGILSFKGTKATVNTSQTVYCYLYFEQYEYGDLAKAILLAENDSSTVSEAINYIVSKGTPDFSTTSTTDEGLYAAEDDYGTSYYFRGAVEDNYVYFAGFYWRIVRINGDGSVRLIYDGTEKHANGDSDTDRIIGTYLWDDSGYFAGDNNRPMLSEYTGYMHGVIKWDESYSSTSTWTNVSSALYYCSSTYSFDEDTGLYTLGNDYVSIYNASISTFAEFEESYCLKYNATNTKLYYIYSVSSSEINVYVYQQTATITETGNVVDSIAKDTVDDWYETYILNKSDGTYSYSAYLSDTLFCNDRSGTVSDRFSYKNSSGVFTGVNSPILTCLQQDDAFTVDDTKYGNGDLTYPIGLITADEVIMAGDLFTYYGQAMKSSYDEWPDFTKYYLYTGNSFYTMTTRGLSVLYDYPSYGLYAYYSYEIPSSGIRPVINLSSSVTVTSGDGTYDSPYEVVLS